MTAEELVERAALGKAICESEEQECERCPYVQEKDDQFHCMDHLFYDQRFIIDNSIGMKARQGESSMICKSNVPLLGE